MSNTLKNEVTLAEEIVKHLRNKAIKVSKEYEAVIELNYFIAVYRNEKETIESKRILGKLQNEYYEDIYIAKLDNKNEYKIADDNMQYCFL